MASDFLSSDANKDAVEYSTSDISCTSCHKEINVYKQRSVFQHPILRVLICKKCFDWYSSGEIEKGEDGADLQCRWCGDGGDVFCCNNCSNVFCKECITINLGDEEFSRVESTDKWCCYVCDNEPLNCLRNKYEELKLNLDNGVRITITTEDDDDDDGGEDEGRENKTHFSDNSPNQWEVKNLQLSLIKQQNAKHNLNAFEESVTSLVPISRTLSNSLSYALSQVKKIDSACESQAKGKLDEICNKINLNLHNLLSAFTKVKSGGTRNRNRAKSEKKEKLVKNGKECHSENGCSNASEIKKDSNQSETPRIKLTISKKSLGLPTKAKTLSSTESKNEGISNGDVDEAAVAAVAPADDDEDKDDEDHGDNDGGENESNDEESDKEEEVSGNSSGDEYNPKKDIRDIKEQIKLKKEKGKQPKTKTAKRSLQKIKEKLRLKKLKVQLEKSKKGGSKDGDDDDEDEEEEEGEDDDDNDDGEAANGKGEGSSKKKSSSKKNKKDKKKDDDNVDEDEYASKRRKNILDKKLQKFQRSKMDDDESDEDNKDRDDDKKTKGMNDSFDHDDIDKSIRSISRLLKQKFNKTKDKGEVKDELMKAIDDVDVKDDDNDDDDEDEARHSPDVSMESCTKDPDDQLGAETSRHGDELSVHPEIEKKRKSRITEDLLMDDITGNIDADNDYGDGKEEDSSMRGFDLSNDDDGLEYPIEEEDHAAGGDDDDDDDFNNCDDMIEKVIEHCNSKRKKNLDKFKSLLNSDEEDREPDNDDNNDDNDDDNDNDDNGEHKSDADDVGLRKSKKRDRLLAASLLSSDDEQVANKGKAKYVDGDDMLEDDEEEEEAPSKKKRSRKKKVDEDDEDDDDEDDADGLKAILNESDEDVKKKKRRRIKMESSSDDDDNDDDSSDDMHSSGKKRKKIHKILNSKKLSKETIDAAKAEEERKKRIEERQKLFNQVTVEDSDSPTKCPITTKLVLEMDPESQEPLVEVHKKVICKLKPHQVEAVKFMWSCCVESLEMLKKEEGSGCILAHCMGLGKTLSVISFVHTVLRYGKLTNMKTCLVLTPLNTILNWDSEFERWLKGAQPLDVYEMSTVKDNWSRSEVIKNWKEGGGILIMGYDMFRTLSQLTRVKNKKQKIIITEGLLDPGADIVVCDEGHILKNDNTGLSKACNKIKTRRRIVLTGTPLQNNLVEYHCMVNFVKPNLLGTRREFLNRFVNPITNGQCSDSTPRDVKIMKNRAHVLHETLNGCVQRKDYSALTKYLLPKHEYVISIRLSKVQVDLYQTYLQRSASGETIHGPIRGSRIFTDYQNLMKIWTHPWVLKLDEIRQECRKLYKDDNDSFIDDSNEESLLDSEESAIDAGSESEDDWKPRRKTRNSVENNKGLEPPVKKRKKKAKFSGSMDEEENEEQEDNKEVVKGWKSKSRRGGEEAAADETPMELDDEEKEEDRVSSEWWADFLKMEDEYDTHISGKLMLLSDILKLSESIGDKVLLFSQSLLSLDLIEKFLQQWDEDPKKKLGGTQGWYKGIDYIRMDGSTSAQNRKEWTEMFNDETNQKVRLFLISTKAGSLGINLVAANRVIIFDASWNPTHDVQSIFRVYRFGQTKPVYVYRFLAQGTMEEKIYERQVLKQSLAQRVIDEHQIERHFTSADLRELYTFKPDIYDPENKPPTPKLPNDRLLAEMLKDHDKWIVQYHEHDSLLENRPEEELTEEERKAAWEEYELEKKGLLFKHNNAFSQNMMGQQGDMFSNNYFAEVQKFIQAIYLQNPGITQEQLNEKAKYFMQLQMSQQQSYMQHQQRERERLARLQQANIMRQRIANLQSMGPITIDEEPSSSSYSSPQSSVAVSRS